MYIEYDFGEGSKLYDVQQIGSSYHFNAIEQQENGLYKRVAGAQEYKVGELRFKELFKERSHSNTRVWRGV